MTGSDADFENEVPRTDICEECDEEIVHELVAVNGRHEMIHQARTADEGFKPVTEGSVEVVFKCRCSHVRVEFGPGNAPAWEFPDAWMWADDFDPKEVPRFASE